MEISNPNAFRLLKAQVAALQPRFILTQQDQDTKGTKQVLELGTLFREQPNEDGMQILKTLMQNNQSTAH